MILAALIAGMSSNNIVPAGGGAEKSNMDDIMKNGFATN